MFRNLKDKLKRNQIHFIVPLKKSNNYYDLIEFPFSHGHLPVPLLFPFWKILPLPRGKNRTGEFYHCKKCGKRSFYQSYCGICSCCWDKLEISKKEGYERRFSRKSKVKKYEHFLYPILWLLGLIKYNVGYKPIYRDDMEDDWEDWNYEEYRFQESMDNQGSKVNRVQELIDTYMNSE